MGFFYLKADEVTKDPCSICSEYMGEKVICIAEGVYPSFKTYYPNGSVVLDIPKMNRSVKAEEINFSLLEG